MPSVSAAPGGRTTQYDNELVARMAAGDGAALDELCARHWRTAHGFAVRILRDPAEAERAVQMAFLAAFCTADRFMPGEQTVIAWLTGLTRLRAEELAAVHP